MPTAFPSTFKSTPGTEPEGKYSLDMHLWPLPQKYLVRISASRSGRIGMISSRITMTTDEAAVQAILQQFETAWNAYDSVSLAALFAEDANFIHIKQRREAYAVVSIP